MSSFDVLMSSFRFVQAPVEQNLPTLSGENESSASGGVPELIAARILSSFWFPVPLTVIHGYFAWNASNADCRAASSCFAE